MGVHFAMSLKTLLLFRLFPFRKKNFLKAGFLPALTILIIIVLSAPQALALTRMEGWTLAYAYPTGVKVTGGEAAISDDGTISITGPGEMKLTAKVGGGLETSGKALTFTLESQADAYGVLRVRSTRGIALRRFMLRRGERDYFFDLEAIFGPDDYILAVSLDFLLEGGSVGILDLSVKEAGPAKRIVKALFTTETFTTKMINHINGPTVMGVSFLVAGYILTAILFTALLIIFVIRKKPLLKSAGTSGCSSAPFRAFIVAFVVAAALLAVRTEYRWATLYGQDKVVLPGDATGTRIFTLFSQELPDFLRFLDYVKSTVPEGESVRAATNSAGDYMRLARYRLLPVRSSEGATYIWSYNDHRLFYDEAKMTLMDGVRVIAAPVIRVGVFGGSGKGALYMVTGAPRSASLAGGVSPVAGAGEVDASRLSETAGEGA